MPTVREHIDTQGALIEVSIDFEVWCANCGKGLCGSTAYRRHSVNHFDVHCENCDSDRDSFLAEIETLKEERADLKHEIKLLTEELDNIAKEINEC